MGEQAKTSRCDVFAKRRSQSKECYFANYSRSKTTMRREWAMKNPARKHKDSNSNGFLYSPTLLCDAPFFQAKLFLTFFTVNDIIGVV